LADADNIGGALQPIARLKLPSGNVRPEKRTPLDFNHKKAYNSKSETPIGNTPRGYAEVQYVFKFEDCCCDLN
jgi:hypothetical protein